MIDLNALAESIIPATLPEHITDFRHEIIQPINSWGSYLIVYRWQTGESFIAHTIDTSRLVRLSNEADKANEMWDRCFKVAS